MPRTYYNEVAPGVQNFGYAVGAGPMIAANKFKSGVQSMANTDYLMARAQEAEARANKLKGGGGGGGGGPGDLIDAIAVKIGVPARQARQYIESLLGTAVPDPTSDPSGDANVDTGGLDEAMRTQLRGGVGDLMVQNNLTGKTNFEQFEAGKGKQVQTRALEEALNQAMQPQAPTTPPGVGVGTVYKPGYDPMEDLKSKLATGKFAKTLSVGTGKEITPFQTNASGTVLDAMTGGLDESGQLAEVMRGLNTAKADKEEAHADMYDRKKDEAHAASTGKGVLAPAEQRMFTFYRDAFPNDTPEETFTRVKAARTEDPEKRRDMTKRELIKQHPRWEPDKINEWVDKLTPPKSQAERAMPPKAATPPRPTNVPAGSMYSPSRKQWRAPGGQLYDERGGSTK